ncbi:MAG: ATP-binding protein, partial [Defluviicoccus sp.]|nr:ATP-binding protein [Defluviicoccus sp.]
MKLRLLLGAAIWIVAALLVAGLILSELFAQHVHDRFRIELGHHLDQLAAALDTDDGATQPMIVRPLSDPRFERPLSGLYWQVSADGAVVLRSRSLWDQVLDLPADSVADGQIHEHRLKGPLERPMRVLERSLWLPDRSTPVRIAVGEDQDEIHRALRSFNRTLILSLAALAAVLILAALVQVSLGLRPLRWLRAELATIRSGGGRRFVRPMPSEVQPLIDDLNALLDHADEVVERARLEAGNLAHSLKTHLCVLANEAEQLASSSQPNELAEAGQQIRGRVDAMRRNLDHHMARARAAAS